MGGMIKMRKYKLSQENKDKLDRIFKQNEQFMNENDQGGEYDSWKGIEEQLKNPSKAAGSDKRYIFYVTRLSNDGAFSMEKMEVKSV